MAALWNRAGHYIFVLWFLSSVFLSFFPRLISAVADCMSTILIHTASLGHPSKFQRVSPLGSVKLHGAVVVGVSRLCGVEQRVPPILSRAAIMLGIGPHYFVVAI